MRNEFLARVFEGKSDPMKQFGALLVTWIGFILTGSVSMIVIIGVLDSNDLPDDQPFLNHVAEMDLKSMPKFWLLMANLLQFPGAMAFLWLGTRFLLKRKWQSLLTGAKRFRWKRTFIGFGLWVLLSGAYLLLVYLKEPGTLIFEPNWEEFWLMLPIILLLVPIQCAFEEIAIRGQFMQIQSGRPGRTALYGLISSSIFFALLHSANPEIAEYGYFTMMAQYLLIGLILGMVTILDEGLELAIGMHIGNNLFAFLIVSYPGSALNTPSLLNLTQLEPGQDLFALIGFGMALFAILFGKHPEKIKMIWESRAYTRLEE